MRWTMLIGVFTSEYKINSLSHSVCCEVSADRVFVPVKDCYRSVIVLLGLPHTEMIVQFLLLLLSVLTVSVSLSEKFSLTEDYSVEVLPPTAEDSPVELKASVNLRNILDVVETKQQIR